MMKNTSHGDAWIRCKINIKRDLIWKLCEFTEIGVKCFGYNHDALLKLQPVSCHDTFYLLSRSSSLMLLARISWLHPLCISFPNEPIYSPASTAVTEENLDPASLIQSRFLVAVRHPDDRLCGHLHSLWFIY